MTDRVDKEKYVDDVMDNPNHDKDALLKSLWDDFEVGPHFYGRSPGMDALPDVVKANAIWESVNVAIEKEITPPLFRVKDASYRWWHWITHPIRTYRIRKYLKLVEKKIPAEIDMDAFCNFHADMMAMGMAMYQVKDKDE